MGSEMGSEPVLKGFFIMNACRETSVRHALTQTQVQTQTQLLLADAESPWGSPA